MINNVVIVGRLVREPETFNGANTTVTKFTVALDRGKDKDGNDKGADFPRVTVFGKQAENCAKYLHKGSLVGVEGRIQTGSYEKENGEKVYTTEVVAFRTKFLSPKDFNGDDTQGNIPTQENIPDTFEEIDEEVSF